VNNLNLLDRHDSNKEVRGAGSLIIDSQFDIPELNGVESSFDCEDSGSDTSIHIPVNQRPRMLDTCFDSPPLHGKRRSQQIK